MNQTTFPSIVSFTESGILACDQASNYLVKNSKSTIYGIKRIIGLSPLIPKLHKSFIL